jgi:hypothetical protein
MVFGNKHLLTIKTKNCTDFHFAKCIFMKYIFIKVLISYNYVITQILK